MATPIDTTGSTAVLPEKPATLKPIYPGNLAGIVSELDSGIFYALSQGNPAAFFNSPLGGTDQGQGFINTIGIIMTIIAPTDTTTFEVLQAAYTKMKAIFNANNNAPNSAYAEPLKSFDTAWLSISATINAATVTDPQFNNLVTKIMSKAISMINAAAKGDFSKPATQNLVWNANGMVACLADLNIYTDTNPKDDYIKYAPLRSAFEALQSIIENPEPNQACKDAIAPMQAFANLYKDD
ncbi:MAG: hypothetical protein P0S95_05555 [Rhabdochlamydiaceae bacterium]|nr:hypothetical protein [Candidatus Amphrikana amoebophyrae]